MDDRAEVIVTQMRMEGYPMEKGFRRWHGDFAYILRACKMDVGLMTQVWHALFPLHARRLIVMLREYRANPGWVADNPIPREEYAHHALNENDYGDR